MGALTFLSTLLKGTRSLARRDRLLSGSSFFASAELTLAWDPKAINKQVKTLHRRGVRTGLASSVTVGVASVEGSGFTVGSTELSF